MYDKYFIKATKVTIKISSHQTVITVQTFLLIQAALVSASHTPGAPKHLGVRLGADTEISLCDGKGTKAFPFRF